MVVILWIFCFENMFGVVGGLIGVIVDVKFLFGELWYWVYVFGVVQEYFEVQVWVGGKVMVVYGGDLVVCYYVFIDVD